MRRWPVYAVVEVCFDQVGEEEGDGEVVDRRSHTVDADGQGARSVVGGEVGTGDEEFADQGAGFGFVGEARAQQSEFYRLTEPRFNLRLQAPR